MDSYSSITNPVDKDMVHDLLITEKHLTDSYNTFANEASTKSLYHDLLTILEDEHELGFKLFDEMQRRGWYTVEYASEDDINKVKSSYNKMS